MPNSQSYPPNKQQHQKSDVHFLLRQGFHIERHQIRWFQTKDLAQLVNLHKQWFPIQYQRQFYNSIGNQCKALVLEATLQLEQQQMIKRLIGIIVWMCVPASYWPLSRWYFQEKEAYIMTIGVIDEMRGRGLGSKLLQSLQEKEERLVSMSLHVIQFNEGAKKMYRKSGFKKGKLIKNYYQIDRKDYNAYTYHKQLHPISGLRQVFT